MSNIRKPLDGLLKNDRNPYWDWVKTSPVFGAMADGIALDKFQQEIRLVKMMAKPVPGGARIEAQWLHPQTGLEAEVSYTVFEDTGVLECEGKLVHRGTTTLRNFQPLSLYLNGNVRDVGTPHITTVYGGASVSGAYPLPSYRVELTDMDTGKKQKLRGGKELPVTVGAQNGVRWLKYRPM